MFKESRVSITCLYYRHVEASSALPVSSIEIVFPPSMVTNKENNGNDNLKEPNMVTIVTNNLIEDLNEAEER